MPSGGKGGDDGRVIFAGISGGRKNKLGEGRMQARSRREQVSLPRVGRETLGEHLH